MSNRWTIKQLDELDDITFAMCILSERRETLNQYAPLAKKIHKAFHALEELRDICRGDENFMLGIASAKEAIYRHMERAHTVEDIRGKLEGDTQFINLHGMKPDEILGDRAIINRILYRLDKCGTEGDYWDNIEFSISQGIEDILESRKEC